MFVKAIDFINETFIPNIQRYALAGRAHIRTFNFILSIKSIFDNFIYLFQITLMDFL